MIEVVLPNAVPKTNDELGDWCKTQTGRLYFNFARGF